MGIFIDICVFVVLSVLPYAILILLCKYGTKGQHIRVTLGALMVCLAASCLINGFLGCWILINYDLLPKLF